MEHETLSFHFLPLGAGRFDLLLASSGFQQRLRRPFGLSLAEVDEILKTCASVTAGWGFRNLSCATPGLVGLEELGGRLFRALFPDGLRDVLNQAWGQVLERGSGLRLQLWLDLADPGMAQIGRLPWELLYDAESGRFLLRGDRRCLLTRSLESAEPCPALAVSVPLRVLVAVASPADLPPLDAGRETGLIEKAVTGKAVDIVPLPEATLQGLRAALVAKSPHVVHWIGHGALDIAAREGELLFEGAEGEAAHVPGAVLAEHLRDSDVRMVVLNGCETGKIPDEPLAGVAMALVRAGIPAVVAMQRPILDASSIRFSEAFYGRLAAGDPIDVAVAEARLALFAQNRKSLEWANPVLYLRPPDGRLFDVLPIGEEDRSEETRLSHRPSPVDHLFKWLPAGFTGEALGGLGCLHGGFFLALTSLVLVGRAATDPLWLYLLLALLLPLSLGIAIQTARRRPGLRGPWLFLSAFAAILTIVLGLS